MTLSGGIPALLLNIEQSLLPPLHAGWHVRRKSRHFAAYNQVATEFAELIGIDPWFINPYFSSCGTVNFQERQGEAVSGKKRRHCARYKSAKNTTNTTSTPSRL